MGLVVKKGSNIRCLNSSGIPGPLSAILAQILHQPLATVSRGYTNQVRLRGLTENQGFETREGGFCLCNAPRTSKRYTFSSSGLVGSAHPTKS